MTETRAASPEEPSFVPRATAVGGLGRVWLVVPAAAIVVAICGALVSAQGGYFPTSWGWASTALLAALGIWAISSGRSEIDRRGITFVALLGLFVGWIGLSIAWSHVSAASVLEFERGLVPLSCVAAFLILARRADVEWLTLTLVLATTAVAAYALSTRLYPDRIGAFDPFAVYRLSEPIGYWNGLGIFCVMGMFAGLAVVVGGGSIYVRATAGAATVVQGTALYFTYSRASWVALGIGLATVVAVSTRRLSTIATTAVLAVPLGLAVLAASRSSALTHRESVLPAAVDEGRRLTLVIAVLMVLGFGLIVLLGFAEQRFRPLPRLTRILGLTGWLLVVAVLVGAMVRLGNPVDIAERTWAEFEKPPAETSVDLNERLFSLSGNGRADLWAAAWDVAEANPVAGAGAGTFERFWQARPDTGFKVRDAHGLYIETLAELGVIGLVLLILGLALPLVGALAARRLPLVPALVGGYVAFVVHAGVDWDWELTAVTATGLIAGSLVLVAARARSERTIATPLRAGVVTLALLASIGGMIGLVGNSAVAHGRSAIEAGDTTRAVQQADKAQRLMPWSPEPWLIRGEAELLAGDVVRARRSFREAIAVDPGDWRGWHDLAVASTGRDRARALRRARSLYPNSSEIRRTTETLRTASQETSS